MNEKIAPARDKLLFTPGPLTTSLRVKQAMLRDAGSWHFEFNDMVKEIREEVLRLAGVGRSGGYECVLMQGSGTFGVESVISTAVPRDGVFLVVVNGAYGDRMVQIAERHRIRTEVVAGAEDELPDLRQIEERLARHPEITHVGVVHCETTSGILNPIEAIGRIAKAAGKSYIVDAMSSFGSEPIDVAGWGIDFLVSSANKCLEGVPGFSIVIAQAGALAACEGRARTLSLDLLGQWKGFEKNGQFRFTPPTHTILAFAEALKELEMEGGPAARARRYKRNHEVLVAGMTALGFEMFLRPEVQSSMITSFHYPRHDRFEFGEFYRRLSDLGFIIYPGKVSQANCFRIGSMGRIGEADIGQLLAAIERTLREMGINLK